MSCALECGIMCVCVCELAVSKADSMLPKCKFHSKMDGIFPGRPPCGAFGVFSQVLACAISDRESLTAGYAPMRVPTAMHSRPERACQLGSCVERELRRQTTILGLALF